jgi:hypothetical protein
VPADALELVQDAMAGQIKLDGVPAPNVSVEVWPISAIFVGSHETIEAIVAPPDAGTAPIRLSTDSAGRFQIDEAYTMHYGILAYTDGFMAIDDWPVRGQGGPGAHRKDPSRAELSLELKPAGTFSGHVVYDSDNAPVANALVYPYWHDQYGMPLHPVQSAMLGQRSGSDGYVSFSRILSGRWQFLVKTVDSPFQITGWITTGRPAEIRVNVVKKSPGA